MCEGAARARRQRGRGKRIAGILAMAMAAAFGIARAESVSILQDGDTSAWVERRFKGSTVYETVALDGRTAVRAASEESASGLFRKVRVDIGRMPILRWSWRVEAALNGLDERTREGDDYRARVFVIRNRPTPARMMSALNYVWSRSVEKGAHWRSPYSHAVRMVALRSGNGEAGRWVHERRDVRADFRTLLGREVGYIHGIAIMTDSDDTGGAAVAYYGDIRFASE